METANPPTKRRTTRRLTAPIDNSFIMGIESDDADVIRSCCRSTLAVCAVRLNALKCQTILDSSGELLLSQQGELENLLKIAAEAYKLLLSVNEKSINKSVGFQR
jgi:hypothetical protein